MKDYPEIDVEDCSNNDPRIETLKEQVNDNTSWRNRVDACEKLMHLNCQRSQDILAKIVRNDPVYKVKEAAHFGCRVLKVKRNGELITLPNKPSKCIYDGGIMYKLGHVRNTLNNEFTLIEFKDKFKEMYPIEYDTYEGNEGNFDKWLISKLTTFSDYMMYGDIKGGGKVTYVRFEYRDICKTYVHIPGGMVPITDIQVGDIVYLSNGVDTVPVMSTFHPRFKTLHDRAERKIKKQKNTEFKQRQREDTYARLGKEMPEWKKNHTNPPTKHRPMTYRVGDEVVVTIDNGTKPFNAKVVSVIRTSPKQITSYEVADECGNQYLVKPRMLKRIKKV